jgi:hypothetical protein
VRHTECPRCGGLVCPTTLEGRGRFGTWTVLRASRCVNCGWYGGELGLDVHQRMGVWTPARLFA